MNERATKILGNKGEDAVCLWLAKRGFTICERNFAIRSGEVDIIAQKDEILAFVEVKTRKHNYFATSTVVTRSKQRKIISAAKMYIVKKGIQDKACRFDVAIVTSGDLQETIEYLEDAFQENFGTY